MKNITVRGIDPVLERRLRDSAASQGVSINQWILGALRKVTGCDKEPLVREYQNLDHLAGGWTEQEAEEFLRNTEIFEKVDAELWQ